MEGKVTTGRWTKINLCPRDVSPLSLAPPVEVSKSSLLKGPTKLWKTDDERREELMSDVLAKEKRAEKEEEQLENMAAKRRAPADNDWGEDD